MKKIISLIVLSLLMLSNGCKKKCEPIDDKLLAWMHYKTPEKIIYTNQFADSIFFHFDSEDRSLGYDVDLSSPCHSYVRYTAGGFSQHGISFTIEKTKQAVCFTIIIYYNVDSIHKSGIIKTFYKNINKEIQAVSTNGATYNEALIMEQDTNDYFRYGDSSKDIWKCFVVKDHGLMQFYEKSGVVWTLVE
jgi:hypothetical protein